jgi:hypothetical protein
MDVEQGHYSSAALDLAGNALPAASDELNVGDKAVTQTEGVASANQALDHAMSGGASASDAYAGLTADQRAALDTGSVPITSTAAHEAAESSETAAKTAKFNHNAYGRSLDYGVDYGKDKVKDQINDKLSEAGVP